MTISDFRLAYIHLKIIGRGGGIYSFQIKLPGPGYLFFVKLYGGGGYFFKKGYYFLLLRKFLSEL